MTTRAIVRLACACALVLAATAGAEPAPRRAAGARRAASGARRSAAPPAGTGTRPVAQTPRAAGQASGPPRRLEDIRIEGEIPVPQVLFITAREQRRFMEFQHHRYQRTSLELGQATTMPSQIVVPPDPPVERKEEQR